MDWVEESDSVRGWVEESGSGTEGGDCAEGDLAINGGGYAAEGGQSGGESCCSPEGVRMMFGGMLKRRFQLCSTTTTTRPVHVQGLKFRILHLLPLLHPVTRPGRSGCLVYLGLHEYQCVQLRRYHKLGGCSAVI
jgi:hypothetical protein